jgi:hypothetical protein
MLALLCILDVFIRCPLFQFTIVNSTRLRNLRNTEKESNHPTSYIYALVYKWLLLYYTVLPSAIIILLFEWFVIIVYKA